MIPSPRRGSRWPWDDPTSNGSHALAFWAQVVPACVAIFLYLGGLGNGFAYDDIPVIPDNDWVRHGVVLTQALSLPYWPNGALYRPLTSFTYGIDWLVGGGRPFLFHAVNIAWYAIGTALVARVALRWWPPLAAALAGLLFAAQPLHVESVANVVGRAELLSGAALLLLTLVTASHRPLTRGRLFAIAALAALSLAAKETGAVAPLVVWAAARMRRDAKPGDARRATVAALLGIALPLTQRALVLGTLAGDTPHAAFAVATPTQALELALASIPRAAGMLVVPQLPRIDYSPTAVEVSHSSPLLVALGALLVAAGATLIVLHARRPTRWSWAAVFSVVTFLPVSNLVLHTGVVLADRTLYSPSVGIALLAAGVLAAHAARRWSIAWSAGRVGVALALMIVGGEDCLRTIPVWHDNVSVFTAMRDRAPTSYRGYYLLGKERRTGGPSADAQRDYVTAIALFGGDPGLLYDAGVNALTLGDTSDALTWLTAAVRRNPGQRRARTSLALLHLRRADRDEARALLRDGLAMEPDQHLWRRMLDSLDRADDRAASPLTPPTPTPTPHGGP